MAFNKKSEVGQFIAQPIPSQKNSIQLVTQENSLQLANQENSLQLANQENSLQLASQENSLQLASQENSLQLASQENSLQISSQENSIQVQGQENSMQMNSQENSMQMASQENSVQLSLQENSVQLSLQESSVQVSNQENSVQVQSQENSIQVQGQENSLQLANQENSIQLQGQENSIQVQGQENSVQVIGQENSIQVQGQENSIQINGQELSISLTNDEQDIIPAFSTEAFGYNTFVNPKYPNIKEAVNTTSIRNTGMVSKGNNYQLSDVFNCNVLSNSSVSLSYTIGFIEFEYQVVCTSQTTKMPQIDMSSLKLPMNDYDQYNSTVHFLDLPTIAYAKVFGNTTMCIYVQIPILYSTAPTFNYEYYETLTGQAVATRLMRHVVTSIYQGQLKNAALNSPLNYINSCKVDSCKINKYWTNVTSSSLITVNIEELAVDCDTFYTENNVYNWNGTAVGICKIQSISGATEKIDNLYYHYQVPDYYSIAGLNTVFVIELVDLKIRLDIYYKLGVGVIPCVSITEEGFTDYLSPINYEQYVNYTATLVRVANVNYQEEENGKHLISFDAVLSNNETYRYILILKKISKFSGYGFVSDKINDKYILIMHFTDGNAVTLEAANSQVQAHESKIFNTKSNLNSKSVKTAINKKNYLCNFYLFDDTIYQHILGSFTFAFGQAFCFNSFLFYDKILMAYSDMVEVGEVGYGLPMIYPNMNLSCNSISTANIPWDDANTWTNSQVNPSIKQCINGLGTSNDTPRVSMFYVIHSPLITNGNLLASKSASVYDMFGHELTGSTIYTSDYKHVFGNKSYIACKSNFVETLKKTKYSGISHLNLGSGIFFSVGNYLICTNSNGTYIYYFDRETEFNLIARITIPNIIPPIQVGQTLYIGGTLNNAFTICQIDFNQGGRNVNYIYKNTSQSNYQMTSIIDDNSMSFIEVFNSSITVHILEFNSINHISFIHSLSEYTPVQLKLVDINAYLNLTIADTNHYNKAITFVNNQTTYTIESQQNPYHSMRGKQFIVTHLIVTFNTSIASSTDATKLKVHSIIGNTSTDLGYTTLSSAQLTYYIPFANRELSEVRYKLEIPAGCVLSDVKYKGYYQQLI